MERNTDWSTAQHVDAMTFSFISNHRRKPLEGLDRLKRPSLPRAYLAILEDALRLERVQLNPQGKRTPEFGYLVSLMHHIVQWALRGQAQMPTDSPSEAPPELDMLDRKLQTIKPEECKRPPADSCLCWLVRLVAIHRTPKTPGRCWTHGSEVMIVR